MGLKNGKRKDDRQRPHLPHQLGPRIFARGRWRAADLRPWRKDYRPTLRDPDAPGWPARGERTEFDDVALRWALVYVDRLRDATHRRQLKLAPNAKRLEDAIAAYLEHRDATQEPYTVRNDRGVLTGHLLALGCLTTADVSTAALQAYFNGLARKGHKPGTLATYRNVMSGFFSWLGGENPVAGVQLRDLGKPDVIPWTDAELAELRRVADRLDRQAEKPRDWPPSWRLCLELGLGTGGRSGELLALEWGQFNAAERTVRFTRQLDERGHGVKQLKGKQSRTALALPSWFAYARRLRAPARGRVIVLEAVPSVEYARRWMRILYRAAGLMQPGRGWHTLRHTYARQFLEEGGTLLELQKSLGHTSIRTTESDYEHFTHETAASSARRRIYPADPVGAARGVPRGRSRRASGNISGTTSP